MDQQTFSETEIKMEICYNGLKRAIGKALYTKVDKTSLEHLTKFYCFVFSNLLCIYLYVYWHQFRSYWRTWSLCAHFFMLTCIW